MPSMPHTGFAGGSSWKDLQKWFACPHPEAWAQTAKRTQLVLQKLREKTVSKPPDVLQQPPETHFTAGVFRNGDVLLMVSAALSVPGLRRLQSKACAGH